MVLSTYLKFFECPGEPEKIIMYSTARGSSIKVDKSMLDDASAGRLSSQESQTLELRGFLVPDHKTERDLILSRFEAANQRPRPFTTLVTLNLDCNLACVYCYEDHFRGKRYMSAKTADQLVHYIVENKIKSGMDVIVDFYGGEALLSLKQMKNIAKQLGSAAATFGVKFSFNLVSNGTLLTRENAGELKLLGLENVKLTIDGPPDIHNEQRPFVSGHGSYDRIFENMSSILDIVNVQVGGNYSKENYRRFPELLDSILGQGIRPEQLGYVTFSPITPTAGEAGLNDYAMGCASSDEPWLIEASLYLRNEILKRGFKTPRPRLAACMIEFENDLVVGWDGSLFKCPAFMGWDDLKVGTLTDGLEKYSNSHKLDIWKTEECLDCPYLPLCFGGCRFLRKIRTGAIDGVDCRKHYFDNALQYILFQDLRLQAYST